MPAGPPVFYGHPTAGDGVIVSTYSSRVFPFFLASTMRALRQNTQSVELLSMTICYNMAFA